MDAYIVHLCCSCPDARGWTAWIRAQDETDAVAQAVDDATTCARCGQVFASCDGAEAEKVDE